MSVTLVSRDNERFEVDKGTLRQSTLLTTMLDDLDDSQDPTIPLSYITGDVLTKVLEFCHHHRHDPILESDEIDDPRKRSNDIDEWDMRFFWVDQEMLFELILVADFLCIQPLLDVGCKIVANLIKGLTPEEIRARFNIENDFTPEEEAQIRKENEWAEDR